jgi:hypothetical protein
MSAAPKSHNATMPAKTMTMIKKMRSFGIGVLYPMKTCLTLIGALYSCGVRLVAVRNSSGSFAMFAATLRTTRDLPALPYPS